LIFNSETYLLSPRFSIRCHSTCWSALHYGYEKNGSLGKFTILKLVDATGACFLIWGDVWQFPTPVSAAS